MRYFYKLSVLVLGLSLSFSVKADEVSQLKKQIIDLSFENIANDDTRVVVRQKLNRLTMELAALSPAVTEERLGLFSPGSWQQIWSDERDNSPPGSPKLDLNQVYQVISPEGWGYNFGVRLINGVIPVTFALLAEASVSGNKQTTEIKKAFSRGRGLSTGESVRQLAEEIHSGKSLEFTERDAGQFPNGPIGAKGVLTILFIDQDLKIGTSPNVYTGFNEMFVMHRRDAVK